MKKYRITIAEAITYRQFVCEIEAETEEEAKEIAKKEFIHSYYQFRYHFSIIMCHEVLNLV